MKPGPSAKREIQGRVSSGGAASIILQAGGHSAAQPLYLLFETRALAEAGVIPVAGCDTRPRPLL